MAQYIVVPLSPVLEFEVARQFSDASVRGAGGFGPGRQ